MRSSRLMWQNGIVLQGWLLYKKKQLLMDLHSAVTKCDRSGTVINYDTDSNGKKLEDYRGITVDEKKLERFYSIDNEQEVKEQRVIEYLQSIHHSMITFLTPKNCEE